MEAAHLHLLLQDGGDGEEHDGVGEEQAGGTGQAEPIHNFKKISHNALEA